MTPSDLLSTSFEFQQGAATKWSGRMTGAKPKVAALVEKGSIHRAESCINGVMTSDAVMLLWCCYLPGRFLLPYLTYFHIFSSPSMFPQGLHMADIDKCNRKSMDWDRMEQVLLVSCFQFQPCLAEATDSAGSRRECTQCTKIPPTQAQLHPVWKLQTLTDRDIRKTGITAGKCEVHRDAQRQLCINNAAGVGPCN